MADLSEMANEIFELREKKTELTRKVKELNQDIEILMHDLVDEMKEANLLSVKTELCTASLNVKTQFSIKDKEEFYRQAVEQGRFELLQSRVNVKPALLILENDGLVFPGLDTYMKESIGIRRRP
jgi:hypothetical protein